MTVRTNDTGMCFLSLSLFPRREATAPRSPPRVAQEFRVHGRADADPAVASRLGDTEQDVTLLQVSLLERPRRPSVDEFTLEGTIRRDNETLNRHAREDSL